MKSTFEPLASYDLIRFCDQYQERLASAEAELAPKRGLKSEKEWLAISREVLREALGPSAGLLERARRLPELAEVREDFAAVYQGQWVDMLEKLHAGFTFHCGSRDPVIEALFPHVKFAALRKVGPEGTREYAAQLERRLKSSYLTRMLNEPAYAFAAPVLEQVKAAFAQWESAFGGVSASEASDAPEAEFANLRTEMKEAAQRLDRALAQTRLLAEAALVPCEDIFEHAGLAAKPKKRPAKAEPKAAALTEEKEKVGEPELAEPTPLPKVRKSKANGEVKEAADGSPN